MPIVEVKMVEGRSDEQIRRLIREITDAVESSLDVPRQNVRVLVHEIAPTRWAKGDMTIDERRQET